MVRRLIQMRMLDKGLLFGRWWLIAVDGTLRTQGHDTKEGEGRHRYVLTASLVGPYGLTFPLMSEFMDMHDPVRDKEDCELNAFRRLATRLRADFPHLPICLLLDGLYPVKPVFDICDEYEWMFVATLREGRQPLAYDEAVQTMMMSPSHIFRGQQRTRRSGRTDPSLDQRRTLRSTCVQCLVQRGDQPDVRGEMLNRTGADVGSDIKLFDNAQIFIFCSAVVSREVMEADPANLVHCPYGIYVAERDGAVTIGHRDYPEGPMDAVETLLKDIVAEAGGV